LSKRFPHRDGNNPPHRASFSPDIALPRYFLRHLPKIKRRFGFTRRFFTACPSCERAQIMGKAHNRLFSLPCIG
jgi:hypothetical protein